MLEAEEREAEQKEEVKDRDNIQVMKELAKQGLAEWDNEHEGTAKRPLEEEEEGEEDAQPGVHKYRYFPSLRLRPRKKQKESSDAATKLKDLIAAQKGNPPPSKPSIKAKAKGQRKMLSFDPEEDEF